MSHVTIKTNLDPLESVSILPYLVLTIFFQKQQLGGSLPKSEEGSEALGHDFWGAGEGGDDSTGQSDVLKDSSTGGTILRE